jgi:hypothetical protein
MKRTNAKRLTMCLLPIACLGLIGCPEDVPRKPDPTKGTVSGIVLCTDTGKPARFAQVQLFSAALFQKQNKEDFSNVDLDENTATDLDGHFTIEAVPPGNYYAYATLDGYLDLSLAVRLNGFDTENSDAQITEALSPWRDRLIAVSVSAQHTTNLSLEVERGATIEGKVTYDDSSPAIGLRFQILYKTAKGTWQAASGGSNGWSLDDKSDSHGRYRIGNLPAGEYKVCALLPLHAEELSPHICLGNKFRRKDATPIKVDAGETRAGADIEIPLSGLHPVSGNIEAAADGHAPSQAVLSLLYADDRQPERVIEMRKDGSFSFPYVPEGNYILRVSGAQDAIAPPASGTAVDASHPQTPPQVRHYIDKEIPIAVHSEMTGIDVSLTEAVEAKPTQQ